VKLKFKFPAVVLSNEIQLHITVLVVVGVGVRVGVGVGVPGQLINKNSSHPIESVTTTKTWLSPSNCEGTVSCSVGGTEITPVATT
jgi:hypothetical protein